MVPRRSVGALIILTLQLTGGAACATAQLAEVQPATVGIAQLAATPERFENADIKIVGRLASEGNYFSRNRKFFLVDDRQGRIEVKPWLPLSAPPPRSDSSAQPKTLADMIGQRVELRGGLSRTADAAGSWQFVVKSAQPAPQ
jgi:hypothetical protein